MRRCEKIKRQAFSTHLSPPLDNGPTSPGHSLGRTRDWKFQAQMLASPSSNRTMVPNCLRWVPLPKSFHNWSYMDKMDNDISKCARIVSKTPTQTPCCPQNVKRFRVRPTSDLTPSIPSDTLSWGSIESQQKLMSEFKINRFIGRPSNLGGSSFKN